MQLHHRVRVLERALASAFTLSAALITTPAQAAITMEAETMSRSGYLLDGSYIKVSEGLSSGTATKTFTGASGTYDIQVQVRAENDGTPALDLYKGSLLLRRYTYPTTSSSQTSASFTVSGVPLQSGETIRIVGRPDRGALARVDRLVYTAVTTAPTSSTSTAAMTVEAESMSRSGYSLDGSYIKVTDDGRSSGTATSSFSGASGTYDIDIHVRAENDGRPTLDVLKGSSLLKTFTYPATSNSQSAASFTLPGVPLANGDSLRLVGRVNGGALARIDKVVYRPVSVSTTPPVTEPGDTTTPSSPSPVTTTIEAEGMSRTGYALDGRLIKIVSGTTGTATTRFGGASGNYRMQVYVQPETDGQSKLDVYKGSTLLKQYTYPLSGSATSFTVDNVALATGDTLKLFGTIGGGALARVDKVVLTPVTSTAPAPAPAPEPAPAPSTGTPTQGSTGGLPVIPGASGFGINTRAGRGGTVHRVTNLNASGTGSLKACVDASGPRVCVFETAGTIKLSSVMAIKNPYITIAGQTAPSPGVLIRGAGIAIQTHDVLMQHLRVRVGDDATGPGSDRDVISVLSNGTDVYNVVLDHVSGSWSTDEIFSTWANPTGTSKIYDVTVRNSIFSEALSYSAIRSEEHSAGVMIGPGTSRVTLANNIFGYNGWRNPLIRDNSTDVMVVNNLLYRTRGATNDQIDFGTRGSLNTPMRASVVGNNFVLASGLTARPTIFINSQAASTFKLHQKDNLGPLYSSTNPWSVVALNGRSQSSVEAITPPVWAPGVVAMPATSVEPYVLAKAGARPLDRDAVDARVVANIRGRKGSIINHPSDVGGWPNLAANRRALTLPANANVTQPSGYTNLELWLHQMAREVEGS